MKPIEFEEHNKILNKPPGMTDEECSCLYVYSDGKQCISKWNMSWKERLRCLFFGFVWVRVWFGETQPPIYIGAEKTPFTKSKKE